MSDAGWLFLVVSWGAVAILVLYSIYKVFASSE